jgi:hypothetical protein
VVTERGEKVTVAAPERTPDGDARYPARNVPNLGHPEEPSVTD